MRHLIIFLLLVGIASSQWQPDGRTDSSGNSVVAIKGSVVVTNSTATPLAEDATYTGEWFDITDCAILYVTVYADQASATDGMTLQFSTDGANIDSTDSFSIPAATGKTFSFNPSTKYVRVYYTNGAVAQTAFRLQTMCKSSYGKPSSHRIQDAISTDDDAELTKSVITGSDGATFRNVNVTTDGDLTVSDNSSGLSIAQGNVTGVSFIHKFGAAPDFDTTDNQVTVWDGADDSGINAMTYTYSSSADIGIISSSSASDTVDIEIQGLDGDYNLVTQTITLTGQTDVDISGVGGTDLLRVFRMKNVGSTSLVGHVYIRTNGSGQSGGIPSTANTVRAVIDNGNNQTEMAVYTIPAGHTGYMRSLFGSTAGASKNSNYILRLVARPFGQVFQLKHRMSISDSGSSHIQHEYVEPEVFAEKTDIEISAQMTASGASDAAIAAGFDIVLVQD